MLYMFVDNKSIKRNNIINIIMILNRLAKRILNALKTILLRLVGAEVFTAVFWVVLVCSLLILCTNV